MTQTTAAQIKHDLLENLHELGSLTVSQIRYCYEVSPQVATAALQGLVRDGVLTASRVNDCLVYTARA